MPISRGPESRQGAGPGPTLLPPITASASGPDPPRCTGSLNTAEWPHVSEARTRACRAGLGTMTRSHHRLPGGRGAS